MDINNFNMKGWKQQHLTAQMKEMLSSDFADLRVDFSNNPNKASAYHEAFRKTKFISDKLKEQEEDINIFKMRVRHFLSDLKRDMKEHLYHKCKE